MVDFVRETDARGKSFQRSVSLRVGPLPPPPIGVRRSLIAPASTSSPIVEDKKLLRDDESRHSQIRDDNSQVSYRVTDSKRGSIVKDANANSVRIITDQNRNGLFVDSELCRNLFLELHSTPMENRLNSFDRRASVQEYETSYYVSKELLMTERTYKRDLEILTFWFRDHFDKTVQSPENAADVKADFVPQLFQLLDPVYKQHCRLLRDLEHRIAAMEGRPVTGTNSGSFEGVGSLLLEYINMVPHYKAYAARLPGILERYHTALTTNTNFRCTIESFEANKVCYVPLVLLLTRPLHRLSHYAKVSQKLLKFYPEEHPDRRFCDQVSDKLRPVLATVSAQVQQAKNKVKLMELERDLSGVDGIMEKEFVREGCLQKLSKKGYQQRMFFLFSDCLVYASRCHEDPGLKFRSHGQIQLRGLMVEESEPRMGVVHCFTIYAPHRALMVAAHSEEERRRWIKCLQRVVDASSSPESDINVYSSLQSCNSSDECLSSGVASNGTSSNRSSVASNVPPQVNKSNQYPRCNTTLHVCWLRQISVAKEDYEKSGLNHYLSGYLLRKFKHSSGWQKLWIVFTDFSLFFYKSYQDTTPLACLPLLGYSIRVPGPGDGVDKEFVLKLQFKSHTYFFRAESEYTFTRWMEAIGSATSKILSV